MKFHCISELAVGDTTTVMGEIELRVWVITRGTDQERPAKLNEVSMDDLETLLRWLRGKLERAFDGEEQS